jgi:hypothetical protein
MPEHNTDSEQEYRHESHFTHLQSNIQEHSEQSFHETGKTSPTNELGKNHRAGPKEESPKRRVETQTKIEPEKKITETFHKQQKGNGDYFCEDKVHKNETPEKSNLYLVL